MSKPGRRNADLPVRAAVGIALIAVAASALWWGGFAFWLVTTVAAIIMVDEWGGLHGATSAQRRLTQYALMVPLAITSTMGWIRRMGGKNWQALHRLAYACGVAGVLRGRLIVNMPGGSGAVRDGLAILLPVLEHACETIAGPVDHG